jgi:hypothetical protein
MAANSALQKFAKGGVVLEGRGAKLAAAAFAIASLTVAAPQAEAMPRNKQPEVKIPYQEILKDVRSQVEAEFPGQIFIVDRTADPRAEAARLAKIVGIPAQFRDIDPQELTGSAQSKPFQGTRKTVCVVIGAEPWISSNEINGLPSDMPAKMGMLDDANAHRTVLWHEVGHCLAGGAEAKADAFGALKMMTDLKSTKTVETLTVTRELSEWLGPPGDDHLISPALRGILTTYGNEEFMTAKHSLKELAKIAMGVPDPDLKRVSKVRDALGRVRVSEEQRYFVPVKEGYVATTMFNWLRASSSVPEFKRIIELTDLLVADPATRVLPAPFAADPKASTIAIAGLAAAGDPVARRIAPALGGVAASSDVPITTGDGLPSAKAIEGRTIAFERASTVVKFSQDFSGFLIREAGTNKPLFAGNATKGVTKTFGPKAPKASYHDAEPDRGSSGPRM